MGSNPTAGVDVCRECCVLSGRDLCDELITRPEESYRLWCVVVCVLETSRMRGILTHWALLRQIKKTVIGKNMVTFFTGGDSNNRRSFVLQKFLKQNYNATVYIRYTLEVITLNVYVFCIIIYILNHVPHCMQ